jgi:hypothetical protein
MNNIGKHTLAYLTPGLAEVIKITADNASNMSWYGLGSAVQYTRNALYVTTPAMLISVNKKEEDRSITRISLTTFLFLASAMYFGKWAHESARCYPGFVNQYVRRDLPKFFQSDLKLRTAAAAATTIPFTTMYLAQYGLEKGVNYCSQKIRNN